MKVGIPREIHPGERRVAATPETVQKLRKLGFDVYVQSKAGEGARFNDDAYRAAGATVIEDVAALWSSCDLILKVRPPERNGELDRHELELIPEGGKIVSLVFPGQNQELLSRLAARQVTSIALDCIPRISRAQKMDVLSSMANIAGYRAIIEASHHFGSFFGGQITAAGKTRPARVLVIGAGVAGLSAMGAARGLGAEVRAFDTRPACKEQVESMGAKFLELDFEEDGTGAGGYAKVMSKEFIEAEMKLFREQCEEVDIVVTTALIPGKPAPRLITKAMVEAMNPGSVVVDLAAEQGGNCEVTVADQTVEHAGVTVIGYTDLTSRLATHASQFFGNNLVHLLDDMGGSENFRVDHEDEVVRGALVTEAGEVTWPPPKVSQPEPKKPAPPVEPVEDPPIASKPAAKEASGKGSLIALAAFAAVMIAVGTSAPTAFIQHFTVFVLACFIGWQVVWNVTHALHTPLMAVTNAISGIIIVGGILQASGTDLDTPTILGILAIFFASMNVFGGFLVTQRMLRMFHK
ncbi:MAG: Re/Si-specific NAD(P)(+) transhydrogenase subunit alpha [Myxococcota bacterium]|nr:Re/Si-specific NAD(P)(+) transhydrogenase subunit alpha [Myxococcota bacterium]